MEAILEALEDIARKRDDLPPVRSPELSGDIDIPGPSVASALGFPRPASVGELLERLDGETITVLRINCRNGISEGWKLFLAELCKATRTTDTERRLGPVLAILTECREFPPIRAGVGVRVRALWNVARWEECRLLVESMLDIKENALFRAWRIAVYCAVSNQNPTLISLLCRNRPNSLNETIEMALDQVGGGKIAPAGTPMLFLPEHRWEIPSHVVCDWAEGRISGSTLERGSTLNIEFMEREDARKYMFDKIWIEQVAGLLPLIMEIGFSSAQAAMNVAGSARFGELDEDQYRMDGRVILEPTEIIRRLEGPPKTRVPNTLWQTLLLLNKTRNDLAHMRAVELGRIRQLWQNYDGVRRRYGH